MSRVSRDVWKNFAAQEVSHSMAHYITSIHDLRERLGYARISDVARELAVTKGSASVQVKHLKEKGFVAEDDNRHLQLTDTGEEVAHQVRYNRQVLMRFLRDLLGVEAAQAEEDACKIEHLLSDETCRQIVMLVRLLDSGEPTGRRFLQKLREYQEQYSGGSPDGSPVGEPGPSE